MFDQPLVYALWIHGSGDERTYKVDRNFFGTYQSRLAAQIRAENMSYGYCNDILHWETSKEGDSVARNGACVYTVSEHVVKPQEEPKARKPKANEIQIRQALNLLGRDPINNKAEPIKDPDFLNEEEWQQKYLTETGGLQDEAPLTSPYASVDPSAPAPAGVSMRSSSWKPDVG